MVFNYLIASRCLAVTEKHLPAYTSNQLRNSFNLVALISTIESFN